MGGVEVVFELWLDDEGVPSLAEELRDADLGYGPGVHGAISASEAGADDVQGVLQASKALQEHERLLKAYRGEPGVAGFFPSAPGSLPYSAPAPPQSWQPSQAPLEWLPAPQAKQPFSLAALQHEPSAAHAAQNQLMRARSDGLDVQQALDAVPTMASITSVSPTCIYLPPGLQDASVCLSVTGTHLGDAGCQLLGRSKADCSHDMQVQQLVRKSATVQVTVHRVSNPSCLLLEARMNQIVSQSRAVLLVDDAAMAHELQQPQQARHPSAAASSEPTVNDALIRDLGTWLEYCHERRSEGQSSAGPAAIQGQQQPQLTAGPMHGADAALDLNSASAVARINSLLPGGSSLQGRQGGSVAAVQHAINMKKTMTRLGVHLLEHAVGAGWCAVSTRIVHELMEVQGLCMDTIFRLACSQGLPLLHRAICSSHIQMLHTVLRWGDATDHEWDLANLVPTRNRRGSEVYVSALHLAAALSDHGYAAELLLLKYGDARKLWNRVRDSRGLLPCQYAAVAGNQHLDVLANRLLEAPERPLGPADQGGAGQRRAALGCDELPKLGAISPQASARAKGRRVPRAAAPPGLSSIGRFLEQAHSEALQPPPTSPVDPPEFDGDTEQRWRLLSDDDALGPAAEAAVHDGAGTQAAALGEVEAGDIDAAPYVRPALASWATDASSTLAAQGEDSSAASLARSLGLPLQPPAGAAGPLNSTTASVPEVEEVEPSQSRPPRSAFLQPRWVWVLAGLAWLVLHLLCLPLVQATVLPSFGELGAGGSVLAQLLTLVLAALVEAAVALTAFKHH